jgi:hypothetical protein
MQVFIKNRVEIDYNYFKQLIFKLENNGIGEYGIRQLNKCPWRNLSSLNIGNIILI